MKINSDPLQYNISNKVTRRDATVTLDEFVPKLTWNESNLRVIDIGCADGSVTDIIRSYLPNNYEILLGCDISERMVKFADIHYGNERTKFIQLDITAELQEHLKESFGYVFCLYVFHWIKKEEIGYRNIYNLMVKGGECIISFLGNSPVYGVFIALSKTEKWGPYMKDIYEVTALYHDYQSPDVVLTKLLKEIGFSYVELKCKQMVYVYEDQNELKNIIGAINPFQFPTQDVQKDFLNAYVGMAREMKLMDEVTKTIQYNYNLFLIHCIK